MQVPRGPGLWKLNTSHLNNADFVKALNDCVKQTIGTINALAPLEKWEMLKHEICATCIVKSREIAKAKNKESEQLYALSGQFKQTLDLEGGLSEEQTLQQQECEVKIKEILDHKAKGCLLRCKTQWYGYGEKSLKYFFSLEKSKANKKCMTALKKQNGELITSPAEILQMQLEYYQQLYKSNNEVAFSIKIPDTQNKLTQEQKDLLDWELELDELTTALFNMPNNKTPGSDGLPAELYKVLWKDICTIYYERIIESIKLGVLPLSTKRGVITSMPKKDCDVLLLKNWRSLTMLNVDYKVMAKALAACMKLVLPDIIDIDQTGFMANRNIMSNIRRAMEICEFARVTQC